jgi:hypothetical protein
MTINIERIYTYKSKSTFLHKNYQPCHHRTSQCPNQCHHSDTIYSFQINSLNVQINPNSTSAQYCTPVKEGDVYRIGRRQLLSSMLMNDFLMLVNGEDVELDWNHDYVTRGGCSSPEYTVVRLEKVRTSNK